MPVVISTGVGFFWGPETQILNLGRMVWVPVPQKRPMQVEITTGISDGSFTEAVSGNLKEGDEVITDAMGGNNKSGSSASTPPTMRLR